MSIFDLIINIIFEKSRKIEENQEKKNTFQVPRPSVRKKMIKHMNARSQPFSSLAAHEERAPKMSDLHLGRFVFIRGTAYGWQPVCHECENDCLFEGCDFEGWHGYDTDKYEDAKTEAEQHFRDYHKNPMVKSARKR